MYAPNLQDVVKTINGVFVVKNLGTYGLLTPRIFGFSKKQSTDPLIPPNTCVIFDQNLYEKLYDWSFSESENPDLDFLMHGIKLYFMRNPCLWLTMFRELRVWNRDDFARHLAENHGILLKNYLDEKRNRDIILIDPLSIVFFSHADADKH